MPPHRQINRFASDTRTSQNKRTTRVIAVSIQCNALSSCMFLKVNDVMPVYVLNVCMLQKMCSSDPLWSDFMVGNRIRTGDR